MHHSSSPKLGRGLAVAAPALVGLLLATVHPVHAAELYWDINGATPNTGATAGGNWDGVTANWNTDATGDAAGTTTATTATVDVLRFSSGTNHSGASTVTLSGTQGAGSLFFEEGTVTITSSVASVLAFGSGASEINVASGLTANLGNNANTTITGSNGLTKTGSGNLILGNAANSGLTGVISIKAGALAAGSNTTNATNGQLISLGDTTGTASATFSLNRNQNYNSAVVVNAGSSGVKRISGGPSLTAQQVPSITAAITLNDHLTLGNGSGGVYTTGNNYGGVRLSGVITGNKTITVDGGNAFTDPTTYTTNIANATLATTMAQIAGANASTFTGNVAIERGALVIQNTGAIGTGTAVVSTAIGGVLDLRNQSISIAGLNNGSTTGGSVANLGATIAGTAGTSTLSLMGAGIYSYGGTIVDGTYAGSSVWKTALTAVLGAGSQTLTGANTYTGNTTVTSGTLLVNGTHTLTSGATTGAYSVASGGTLGGTGTIDLANGANLGIGIATGGKLQASSLDSLSLVFSGTGTLDLTGALAGASGSLLFTLGSPSSTLIGTTSASIGSGLLEFDDFLFSTTAGFGVGTFTLLDTNSLNGSLGTNLSGNIAGLLATISLAGNDVVLTTTSAIPEPATVAALAGIAVLAFAAVRRRRHA